MYHFLSEQPVSEQVIELLTSLVGGDREDQRMLWSRASVEECGVRMHSH